MGEEKELTERQKRFCDYYIETLNATESAIEAGYSKKTAYSQGQRMLKKVEIQKFISERLKEKEDARIASQDEVLKLLTEMARGEVLEECVVVEGEGEGVSRAQIIKKQVTPKDRIKAAELLGKRYGIFTEKMALTGEIGVKILDDIEDDEDE